MIAQGLLAPFETGIPADDNMMRMALARLKQLSAHEVGHTLGLMHNYAASVSDRASVMDYPHPVVTLNASGTPDLSNAYATGIGAWTDDEILRAITQGISKNGDTLFPLMPYPNFNRMAKEDRFRAAFLLRGDAEHRQTPGDTFANA